MMTFACILIQVFLRILLQNDLKYKKGCTLNGILTRNIPRKFYIPLDTRPKLNLQFKSWTARTYLTDHLQILLPVLSKFKRINLLLFPVRSSEDSQFFDDLGTNRVNSIA